MASLGSSIRSAAQGTYSAYRRVPVRWRLAGGSAALTFVILACFAVVVGLLTTRQVHTQFRDQENAAFQQLTKELNGRVQFKKSCICLNWSKTKVSLADYAGADRAQIRIFDADDQQLLGTQQDIRGTKAPLNVQLFGEAPTRTGTWVEAGYHVMVGEIDVKPAPSKAILLYALPLSEIDHTVALVEIVLVLGVIGGTILAALAGLFVAQRAMRPIVELTDAAREIERTRDTSKKIPHPEADDEIAELARTFEGMLASLDTARSEIQTMLDRQREFVADASHELRTPLTSVLANLELLNEELVGEQAETAEAALRSTRRMRRLVGDLLLLARADARRQQPHRPTDVGEVLVEVAAELGPMAEHHELSIHAEPVVIDGVRDELHRLMLNLMENAVRHTPPGTRIWASVEAVDGNAVITVEDAGPGVPPQLAGRVFERFVRGGRDGAKGSGLGLAIVRSVAQSHDGTVALEPPHSGHGTRFVIRIPLPPVPAAPEPTVAAGDGAQTSTTTGRTIGRRRNRS